MLKVYNTLTRKTELFQPLTPGVVKIYVCGVTPYDYSHLGHMRPAVVFDVVRRYLQFLGYKVTYVVNFTDVDDKIVQRAREQGADPLTYADPFITDYYESLGSLNVLPADHYPRVSTHISVILQMVEKILANGAAYVANGDVYFSVRNFADYGQLSGRSIDDLIDSGRIEHSPNKRDTLDFALWKGAKEGEPAWQSPWGAGRPGWHIECSAMSTHYLGAMFDIHGGGNDLIFPHHENEIAQSRTAWQSPSFARYWLHNGMVTLKEEKMSKSLKNFFRVRDLLSEYPGEVLRFFLLSAHYRSPVDFSEAILRSFQARMERFEGFFTHLRQRAGDRLERSLVNLMDEEVAELDEANRAFFGGLNDDFNLPQALGALQSLLDSGNLLLKAGKVRAANRAYLELLERGSILGLFESERRWLAGEKSEARSAGPADAFIEAMVRLRLELRKKKEYALGDSIREALGKQGIILEDTAQGTVWRRVARGSGYQESTR